MKTETLVIGLLATAALGGLGYYVFVSTKKPETKKAPSPQPLPLPGPQGGMPAALPGQLDAGLAQGAATASALAAAAAKAAGGFMPPAASPASYAPPAQSASGAAPLSFGALINPMGASQVAQVVQPMSAKEVQHALNVLGASPQLTEDGNYGPKSVAAVKGFQSSIGLSADGIVGPKTVLGIQYALAAHAGMNAPALPAALQGVLTPAGVRLNPDGTLTFNS